MLNEDESPTIDINVEEYDPKVVNTVRYLQRLPSKENRSEENGKTIGETNRSEVISVNKETVSTNPHVDVVRSIESERIKREGIRH